MNIEVDGQQLDLEDYPAFCATLKAYLHIRVGGALVPTPYWINRSGVTGFHGGKGKPEEIQAEVERLLDETGFVPEHENDAIAWLKRKKIGVDCSGFVFAMSEALAKDQSRPSLETWVTPTPDGNPLKQKRFRTNADYLTSEQNSTQIEALGELHVGDLLRLRAGEHVAIVISVDEENIVYAHSGRKTEIKGVHIAVIRVVDWEKHLRDQEWSEQFDDGRNYGEAAMVDERDGVWRLNK